MMGQDADDRRPYLPFQLKAAPTQCSVPGEKWRGKSEIYGHKVGAVGRELVQSTDH